MSIEIILSNYNGACYPGQTIAGRIEAHFTKEKNIRAVRIKFRGRAETEWHESKSEYNSATKKQQTRRVRYHAEEVYFDQEYTLLHGGENFAIPAGKHVYPFSYILPQQLPSSFEGSYGNIRYTVKGVIDRPWKFDYEAKIQLNVSSPLDLNYIPGSRDPIYTSVDKTLCCCWCKSGPVTFDISLPFRGYCPGQQVNIGAYVQNMSNVSAESVKFKIYKNMEFISQYPSTHHKYEEYLVAECLEGGIGAHGEKSWTSTLTIPPNDVYPNLTPCSLINISYQMKGKVVFPCPHTNLDVEFPCIIGSVPLAGDSGPPNFGPPGSQVPLPSYNAISNIPATPYPPGPAIDEPTAPLIPFPAGGSQSVPYASDGLPLGTPYPPTASGYPSTATTISAPYPPKLDEKMPYPSAGPAPYPTAPNFSASAPSDANAPYPTGNGFSPSSGETAPPSYEEAKQFTDKK